MNLILNNAITEKKRLIYLSLFLLFTFKAFFEYFFFDYKVIGDTSAGYNIFQYLYINFPIENRIVPWIEFIDGGYPNILDLKFWNSFFIYPFLIISYFIKNPYVSFQLYLAFIYVVLIYSLNRNLDLLILKNKYFILFFVGILTLFTLDFNYMHQHILSSIWLLYVNFRIQKYFLNFKIIELTKILLFGSFVLYLHPTYLNLIFIFYFGSLLFLIFLVFNLGNIIKKFKVRKKDFYFLIISCFALFLTYVGLDYERDIINVLSSGRNEENLKVSYDSWLSLNSFDPKVSLGHFFYQDWIANYFPLNISFVGIFLIIYFLTSKDKKNFSNSSIISQLIVIFLLFYLAHFSSFYIFEKYLSLFIYNFIPFIDYTRNFIFVLFGVKCLIIITLAFLLDKFLIDIKKFNLKDLIKISLIFFLVYSEFLFTFFKNAIDKKLYIYFMSVSIIFILMSFLLLFLNKFNKKNFISLIILSVISIYISNFYGEHYNVIKPKKFKNFDYVYFNENLNVSSECFSSKDINKIYDYYLNYNLNRYTQKWNTFLLNAKIRPCEVATNQVIVSKNSDLSTDKIFIINSTKEFSGKKIDSKYGQYWERPNHEYSITKNLNGNNYKISNIYTNQNEVIFKRLSNSNYHIEKEPNINNIYSKIRYDKNWKIINNLKENNIQIINHEGFIKIKNVAGVSEIRIRYVNNQLNFINHLILAISLIIVIFLILKIFRKDYS